LSFFSELKRRNVFKVTVVYVVTAWVILQVADVILGNIGAPGWVFKVILLLLCIGLPITVILAWAFDLTPEGLKRTDSSDQATAPEELSDTKPELATTPDVPSGASLAVLPFVNMSGDPENEYFSDGLTEELLNVLANISALKVAARTSSFHFKGRTGDIAGIAQRLGVASVLEGSVRQSGKRVRITAQLINAADGYHLWSETFDRELDDIFAVQDEIASAVATALKVKLLGENSDCQAVGGTKNTEAFQAYLLGVHYRNRGADEEALRAAIDAFQKAVELDPGYAKAYVGLAYAWSQMSANSFVSYEEGLGRMEVGVKKALELAPDLPDGYLALGFILLTHKQDLHGAHKAISTALELNPGNAEVQIEYSRLKCYQGHHDESIAAARRALALDPVSLSANHFLGHVMYFARRFDEAVPVFRHVLNMEPHYPKPHYFIAMSHYLQGDLESAWEEIQQEPLHWMKWTGSALVLWRLGRIEEAEAFLARLSEEEDQEFATVQRADIYAQRGDAELAIKNLNLALAYGDPGLTQSLVDPLLDPLRDDPRFAELMTKIGFERVRVS
jgi:serine/threonine-protein kinase